jgi:hypothetical protein
MTTIRKTHTTEFKTKITKKVTEPGHTQTYFS